MPPGRRARALPPHPPRPSENSSASASRPKPRPALRSPAPAGGRRSARRQGPSDYRRALSYCDSERGARPCALSGVRKGFTCVCEHVVIEHTLDRFGAPSGYVLVHSRVLSHVVELRFGSCVCGKHHILVVSRPDVVVVALSEVLSHLIRFFTIEDGREICSLHLLRPLYAKHRQDCGSHVVGGSVVVAPLASALALRMTHPEDSVGELGVGRPIRAYPCKASGPRARDLQEVLSCQPLSQLILRSKTTTKSTACPYCF